MHSNLIRALADLRHVLEIAWHLSGLNCKQLEAELAARLNRKAAHIFEAVAEPMQRLDHATLIQVLG